MPKRQLLLMFACNFISFTSVNALMSLLPVYLSRLGADPALTGYFFSGIFFALGLGTVFAGWLSDRFQRRKLLLVVASAGWVPMIWLMGQATTIAQLAVFATLYWFAAGIFFSTLNVLVGLFASEDQRGQVFGLLSSAVAIGGVVSGLTSGQIVDRWGFTTLFNILTVVLMLVPLIALQLQDYKETSAPAKQGEKERSFTFSRGFLILFVATVLAFIVNSAGSLSRPLIMTGLEFDATAVSTTVAVGGMIGLPLPFLVGWLSDRIGRKPLMIFCFLANALGLMVLLGSSAAWHFWVSMALQFSMAASMAVGSALISDLVPPDSLGVSLSLFTFSNSIGFVIGFASTGSAMQQLGTPTTLVLGCALAFVSTALLLLIRAGGRKQVVKQVAAATTTL